MARSNVVLIPIISNDLLQAAIGLVTSLEGPQLSAEDIEAFFACLGGNCCFFCFSADINGDGDMGTDADIEEFFRIIAGSPGC